MTPPIVALLHGLTEKAGGGRGGGGVGKWAWARPEGARRGCEKGATHVQERARGRGGEWVAKALRSGRREVQRKSEKKQNRFATDTVSRGCAEMSGPGQERERRDGGRG